MARKNVNRQNLLCVILLQLRNHFAKCDKCRSARKAKAYGEMCSWAQEAIVEVAIRWDRNIPGRLAAINGKDEWIFPCPDPNEHGSAYALTAEACIVAGKQGGMF